MRLIQIAVDRPITTLMAVLIVVVFSVVALLRLPIDLMPDVTFPSLNISVQYPGTTPEEMETLVTRPIEEAIGSVENVEMIDASAGEGRSNIEVMFNWGTNLDVATNEVRDRLDRIRGSLPDDIQPPVLSKWDFNQAPIMQYGLSSSSMPLPDLRYLAEHTLKPRLERLAGVASVEVGGGRLREIHVELIEEKLDALELSPAAIVQAIRVENLNLPAGEVYAGDTQLVMRTRGQFRKPGELEDIVVATREGVPVYLRDVADVNDALEELRRIERIDGNPSITLNVYRQSGGNTVTVADEVKGEMERIKTAYPEISVLTTRDNAQFIKAAIDDVRSSAVIGAILGVLILVIFLRNLRSTLIVASVIPISIMASFALIYFSGFTLNIVSFGGIALGTGMLVDNSIVILENIFRHRENGEDARTAAIEGTREVAAPIISSTLTSVVVFLPLVFLSGAASIMFTQLAYVVAFSQISSLMVGLTLVPSLARQFLRIESLEATENESIAHRLYRLSETAFRNCENAYRRALHFSLRHRYGVIVGSMVLLAAVLPVYNLLGFEYMPESDEGEVRVFGTMAPGTRLDALDAAFTDVERIVREVAGDEISSVYTSFGQPEWFRGGGNARGSLNIQLVPVEQRTRSSQEIADELNARLSGIPGMRLFTRAAGGLFVFRIMSPEADSISVEVRGYDREAGTMIAQRIADILDTIPGISDTRVDRDDGRPEVALQIDRYRAAEAGLSVTDIAGNIRTNFGGEVATRYREGGDEYDVRVRLKESDRHSLNDLREHWIVARTGERVPASNFLNESRVVGPTEIERRNQERVIEVRADLEPEYTLGHIMPTVERELAKLDIPPDFSIYHGGEYEEQQKSFRELIIGLVLAVVLVYMVMAAQFESFVHPFIIMFAIPFAAIGVIGALYITDTSVNVQSFLGVILLVGIAVNNAIVLIDYINMLRREKGFSLQEAVEEGGKRRLRPILMTTLTSVLALVPMALGIGSGAEMQAPMARVVIGGMTTSTLITLIFVPVLYYVVARFREKPATAA